MKTLLINSAVFIALFVLISCGASNKIVEPSKSSKAIDEIVVKKQFKFNAEWARPVATSSLNSVVNSGILPPGNSASQINLVGGAYYFKMEGDSVTADLPYYGERQMGGGYNSENGIKFKGLAKELLFEKEESKQCHNIRFQIKKKAELYSVQMTLFANSNATLNIMSSQRLAIRYDGKIAALDNKE